ncbi:MAG: hypothetical protein R6W79_01255 [Acidimicrobiia bacterium]
MRRSMIPTVLALVLVAAACSSGPTAPDVEPIDRVCTEAFCLDIPAGWGDEVGDTHIAFRHELAADDTFLTASVVDMEAIVTAAGGTWPVPPDEVVEAFWALLEDVDEGSLIRTERQVGGAIRSWGRHSTGDMWHVLVPVEGSIAIAVELRGPNTSWEDHADVVFPSVEPVG